MKRMTVRLLKSKGACSPQIELFKALGGHKTPLTLALCLEHAAKFDWNWAAEKLLSPKGLVEYQRIRTSALAEYQCIEASALAEYQRIQVPAWAEYDRITAPARSEYQSIEASAWAEYRRIQASAWAEYERITAASFFNEWNKT